MLLASWISPDTASAACGETDKIVCIKNGRPWCEPGNRAKGLYFPGIGPKCRAMDRITEPGTNATQSTTYLTQPAGQPLRGYADLHAHMFSNEAFGGLVLWGKPFHFGGVNRALPADDYAYDINSVGTTLGITSPLLSILSQGQTVHGPKHGILGGDPIGDGQHDGAGSDNNGIAFKSTSDGGHDFTGCPKSTSTTHQQMYYKWLERAYQGGMRLMVLLTVNNEVLCKLGKRKKHRDCDVNMQDINIQLTQAYVLQGFIDGKNGGAGNGWFRIVTSPAQARQVIEDGKMAVVLGIETDSLFECKKSGDCSNSFISSEVQKYYDMGVRHIFPVHDFDNEFGGAAAFHTSVNVGNRVARGEYFNIRECVNDGYNFKFDFNDPAGKFGAFLVFGITSYPNYTEQAHCNAKGLTIKGEFLMQELMDKGMLIDIDHMSVRGLESALDLAEARNYPLVASHVNLLDQGIAKDERGRTLSQLSRIRNLGGMVGVGMFKGGDRFGVIEYDDDNDPATPAPVTNDCGNSSKIFAQKYLFAVQEMGALGVALGSDFNGMTQHPGPRFGSNACKDPATGLSDGFPQSNKVQYPFTIPGFGSFNKQVTGDRTFDINEDGLAHVDLVPDFLADLKNVGLSNADLDPLFNSAEAYIQMWERSEVASDSTPPVITAPADIMVNNYPEQATAVVNFAAATATDDSGTVTVTQTSGSASGSAFPIGNTTVSWEAEDLAGNTVSASMTVTVLDNEFPDITAPANIKVSTDPGLTTAV